MENLADLLIFNTIRSSFCKGDHLSLFGEHNAHDLEAFWSSYIGDDFPEVWFELPLSGDPWYDLHVLTSRRVLERDFEIPEDVFFPDVFSWFSTASNVRQLAISHDLSKGVYDRPAVQLLVSGRDDNVVHDFLAAAQNSCATVSYDAFMRRLPKSWFPCYFGTFPSRNSHFLRIECIPVRQDQLLYSSDSRILADHLGSVGYKAGKDTLELIRFMSSLPFPIEFQFDVAEDGTAGAVMSASLRFKMPGVKSDSQQAAFINDGEDVKRLMERLCELDLSDDRWRLLTDIAFAKQLSNAHLAGYPAFIKVRFDADGPVDSKAYLVSRIYYR